MPKSKDKMRHRLTCFFMILFIIPVFVHGQSAPSDTPGSKYKFGFSERFRIETWDNAIGLSRENAAGTSYLRLRTSLSLQWIPSPTFEGDIKLTNEFRNYFVPENKPFDIDEILIDQLYLKFTRPGGYPLTFTLGRQNMLFGEGFLIADGNPLDGSRSLYFNAVRLDYKIGEKHNLTLFYNYQPEKDNLLPIINDKEKPMNDQPEEGFGIYYSGTIGRTAAQAYVIRKYGEATDKFPYTIKIVTLGGRFQYPLLKSLTLTAESAYQLGRYSGADHAALGGYTYFDYKTGWPKQFPQNLIAGAIYLGGDDPGSRNHEGWDPLFGRWPKWSDSYIYTLKNETGVAYWTNLISVFGKMQFAFAPSVKLAIDYHHFMASQKTTIDNPPRPSGQGRGDLLIGKLTYQLNKELSGHIIWEIFKPGSYYPDTADSYNWFRMEFLANI